MSSGKKNLALENCEANSAMNSGHGTPVEFTSTAQTISGWRTYNAGSCTYVYAQFDPVQHFTPMPNQPPRPFYGTCYRYLSANRAYGEQLSEKA